MVTAKKITLHTGLIAQGIFCCVAGLKMRGSYRKNQVYSTVIFRGLKYLSFKEQDDIKSLHFSRCYSCVIHVSKLKNHGKARTNVDIFITHLL